MEALVPLMAIQVVLSVILIIIGISEATGVWEIHKRLTRKKKEQPAKDDQADVRSLEDLFGPDFIAALREQAKEVKNG